jgi:histone H3/H4
MQSNSWLGSNYNWSVRCMSKTKEKIPDFVVKKSIQGFAKTNDLMVGSDVYVAINKAIGDLLRKAIDRCNENKRKTLKAYDL